MRYITLLLLFTLSQASFGATSVNVIASAGGPEEAPDNTEFNQFFDPSSASAAAISPHAGATADAFADHGVIKVFAQQNSLAGGFTGAAFAEGKWSDTMRLNSAGFNGQSAKLTFSITVQGFIAPTGSGRGSVELNVKVGIGSLLTINGAFDATTSNTTTGFPPSGLNIGSGALFYSNIHDLTTQITLGTPFTISEVLTAGAGKNGCQTTATCLLSEAGSVDVDFGHSSYWNGVKSIAVRNPNTGIFENQDISLFSLTGSSGIDYSQSFVPAPVPLPASLLLFAPTLGLLAVTSRRMRS